MGLIRDWLVGVTCAAMVVALAEGMTPKGAVRTVGRLTGGLVLLLALARPLIQVDSGALTRAMEAYQRTWNGSSISLEETNAELMKAIIARQSSAYILDKAAALGIACQVEVLVAQGEEDAYPVPEGVVIRGPLTEEQRAALTEQITAAFAIPAEGQIYQEDVE